MRVLCYRSATHCPIFVGLHGVPQWIEDSSALQPLVILLEKHSLIIRTFPPGTRTHTHIDQDHNMFVQLFGKKRLTLYSRSDHRYMHSFPRVHPLWHKSQVDTGQPASQATSHQHEAADGDHVQISRSRRNDRLYVQDFSLAQPTVVDVIPGDVLYIPPYTWHTVETTEASVSMATLSNENIIRNELEHVYSTNHKFDLLMHPAGKVAAFRMYIDLIVHKLYGDDPLETPKFVASLLRERYGGNVDSLFDLRSTGATATSPPDYMQCHFERYLDKDSSDDGPQEATLTIPTSQEVYHHSAVDANVIGAAFLEIADSEIRDFLFADYFEEVALEVATPEHYATMLTHCFGKRAHYTVTASATDIHNDLWRHYDEEIDGARD
eukprot:m.507338 g.507338  ORF g.507338 m.507338 type:complete len:380 (-) comp21879_c0_seq11:1430-2569(-)